MSAPRTITDGSNNDVSSDATHIANINPIRYRGYYYDIDTGFYYLQSRYYDPVTGRFVNADETDTILCSSKELTDKNLFAYCDNNPILREDKNGFFWKKIAKAFAAVVVVAAVVTITAAFVAATGGTGAAIIGGAVAASKATAVAVTVGNAAATVGIAATIGWGLAEAGNYYYSRQSSWQSSNTKGTPGNNQAQNKQIDDIVNKLKLNKAQRRCLHEEITGRNYSYQEILQIAKDMFGR